MTLWHNGNENVHLVLCRCGRRLGLLLLPQQNSNRMRQETSTSMPKTAIYLVQMKMKSCTVCALRWLIRQISLLPNADTRQATRRGRNSILSIISSERKKKTYRKIHLNSVITHFVSPFRPVGVQHLRLFFPYLIAFFSFVRGSCGSSFAFIQTMWATCELQLHASLLLLSLLMVLLLLLLMKHMENKKILSW